MTTSNKQFMSAFALSAAALFLGACNKGGTEIETPGTAESPADSNAAAEPDQGGEVAPPADEAADELVKCFGINTCKGESACNVNKPELGIEHACAGENDCQGKGWIKVPTSECEEKGGEILS